MIATADAVVSRQTYCRRETGVVTEQMQARLRSDLGEIHRKHSGFYYDH